MTDLATLEIRIVTDRSRQNLRDLNRGLDETRSSGERAGRTAQRLNSSFGRLFSTLAAFAGISLGFGKIASEIQEFEAQMSQVRAVSGATAQDMQRLTERARELGATTSFSAKEAADGLTLLAQAGFSADQSIAAIGDTLKLASAGGLGLAESADIVSNTLGQFGLAADQAGRVADVLAKTASSANTNVSQLGEAMQSAGPVAASLGLSLEQTNAALGVLSNSGRKASEAGTDLRAILASLVAPTNEAQKVLNRFGVTAADLADPGGLFEKLKQGGLSLKDAVVLFGREAASAGLILADAGDEINEFTNKLDEAGGAAGEMSRIMQDNLRGDLKALASVLSEVSLQLGDAGLTSAMRSATQAATEFVRDVTDLLASGRIQTELTVIGKAWRDEFGGFGNVVAESLGEIVDLYRENFDEILGIIRDLPITYAAFFEIISTLTDNLVAQVVAKFERLLLEVERIAQLIALGFIEVVPGIAQAFVNAFNASLNAIRDFSTAVGRQILKISQALRESDLLAAQVTATGLRNVAQGLFNVAKGAESLRIELDLTGESQRQRIAQIDQEISANKELQATLKNVLDVDAQGIAQRALASSAALDQLVVQINSEKDLAKAQEESHRASAKLNKTESELAKTKGEVSDETDKATGSTNKSTESAKKAAQEFANLVQAAQSLIDRLDPLGTAQRQFNAELDILDEALEKTLISGDQHVELVERLARAYEDVLDPLGEFTDSLEEQSRLAAIVDEDQQRIAEAVARARKEFEQYGPAAQQAAAQAAAAFESQQIQIEQQVDITRNAINTFTVSSREFADAWISGLDEVGRFLSDGLVNGFEGAADIIETTFKSLLAELIRQAFINPILVQVGLAGLGASGILGPSAVNAGLNAAGDGGLGGGFGIPGFTLGSNPPGTVPLLPFPSGVNNFLAQSSFLENPLLSGFGGIGGNFLANSIFGSNRGAGSSVGGTIGTIAGSFIPGLPPGVGTAIGGFVGNFLGGLFGGSKPSNKSGTSELFLDSDEIRIGGQTGDKFSQENRDAAQALAELTQTFAQTLTGLGASFEGLIPAFEVGNKTGFSARLFDTQFGGGQVFDQDFETAEDAVAAMFDAIIDNAQALPKALEGLDLSATGLSAEQAIEQLITFGDALLALREAADPTETIGPFEQQLNALNDIFEAGAESAKQLGIGVADMQVNLDKATERLRTEFIGGIEDAINAIRDPEGSARSQAFEQLEAQFEVLRSDAEALGIPLERVNLLYQLQKNSLVELADLGNVLNENAAAVQELVDRYRTATTVVRSTAEIQELLVNTLRDSAVQAGFSAKQIEFFERHVRSLSVDEFPALIDEIERLGRQMGFSDSEIQKVVIALEALAGSMITVEEAAEAAAEAVTDIGALRDEIRSLAVAAAEFGLSIQAQILSIDPTLFDPSVIEATKDGLIALFQSAETAEAQLAVLQQGAGLIQQFLGQAIAAETALANERIAAIQEAADAQLSVINTQLAGLDAQRAAIAAQSDAQLQVINDQIDALQDQRGAIQATAQAQQDAIRDQIDALQDQRNLSQDVAQERIASLQEELSIANQWVSVLDSAQRALQELTFGSANPLPASAQFALAEQEVARLQAEFAAASAENKPDVAADLLAALQTQIGLGQQLFQAPSPEFLAIFNDVISQISGIEGQAETESSRALRLQEELVNLEENSQAELESIDAQIEALRNQSEAIGDQAASTLDSIDAQIEALRTESDELQQQSADSLASIDAQIEALRNEAAVIQADAASQIATEQRALNDKITAFGQTAIEWLNKIQAQAAAIFSEQGRIAIEHLDVALSALTAEQNTANNTANIAVLLVDIRDAVFGLGPQGSFQSGIDFVPRTMNATLHRGERVLTAEENKQFDSGGSIHVTFAPVINAGPTSNGKRIYQEVRREFLRDLPNLGPAIKRQINKS